MTDKITIERETLQAAIDALECALSDSRPYIVKSREVSTTLRAALAAQPAEPLPHWQPIETAPSDTPVLLYTPQIHETTNLERIELRVYHDSRAGSRHAWATHWMPLPPAPKDAALAAQPAEPVAVMWLYPDGRRYTMTWVGQDEDRMQEMIAERGLIRRELYAAPPAPALTYEQIRDLAKESRLDWHRGYMPLFDDDPTNRYEVFARAVLAAGVLPAPAAVPLTKEQRELFDLILHHYGPDKRLQPLRDLIAAAGDKT